MKLAIPNMSTKQTPFQDFTTPSMTPTMDALDREVMEWEVDDEERYQRWEPMTKALKLTGEDRRYFECMADWQSVYAIEDIKRNKALRPIWNRGVREVVSRRDIPHTEASVLDVITGTLPDDNLGLLEIHWQNTEALRRIAGYYPIKKAKAAMWYILPALFATWTDADSNEYSANTLLGENIKRTDLTLYQSLAQTQENTIVPFLKSRFKSQEVSALTYKLGWKETIEAIQDFGADFPGDIRDYDSRTVAQYQAYLAFYRVLAAIIDNTPAAHDAEYDPDGYLSSPYTAEPMTALMHWTRTQLMNAINDVDAMVYADIGEHVNIMIGSVSDLTTAGIFQLRSMQGAGMTWNPDLNNLRRGGKLGKMGGYWVGNFEDQIEIIAVNDDIWPSAGSGKLYLEWRGEERSFENPVVFCPYKVGYRTPRFINNDYVIESETSMDRYAVQAISYMVNALGTVTLT